MFSFLIQSGLIGYVYIGRNVYGIRRACSD